MSASNCDNLCHSSDISCYSRFDSINPSISRNKENKVGPVELDLSKEPQQAESTLSLI